MFACWPDFVSAALSCSFRTCVIGAVSADVGIFYVGVIPGAAGQEAYLMEGPEETKVRLPW